MSSDRSWFFRQARMVTDRQGIDYVQQQTRDPSDENEKQKRSVTFQGSWDRSMKEEGQAETSSVAEENERKQRQHAFVYTIFVCLLSQRKTLAVVVARSTKEVSDC